MNAFNLNIRDYKRNLDGSIDSITLENGQKFESDVGEIEKNKTVTITENGTVTIKPSAGKDAMKKVTAAVAIPLEENKEVSITENGTIEITPISGKSAMEKVTASVSVVSDVTAYAWSKGSDKYAFLNRSIAPFNASDATKMIKLAGDIVAISQLNQNKFNRVSDTKFETITDGTSWLDSTGQQYSTTMNSVCYSESLGLFVIVGDSGVILISSDGNTWTNKTSGVSTSLKKVIYSESLGLFVAVGSSGVILASSDGNTWTQKTSGITTTMNSVCYSESLGLFVAVGDSGAILASSDGDTWSQKTSGITTTIFDIIFATTQFFAVGSGGKLITSHDGSTWANTTIGGNLKYGKSIAYSESLGLFVAVGYSHELFTSSDGSTWANKSNVFSYSMNSVCYSESLGLFVAVGENYCIYVSKDGFNWDFIFSSPANNPMNSVCYSESLGLFVAVGYRVRMKSENTVFVRDATKDVVIWGE